MKALLREFWITLYYFKSLFSSKTGITLFFSWLHVVASISTHYFQVSASHASDLLPQMENSLGFPTTLFALLPQSKLFPQMLQVSEFDFSSSFKLIWNKTRVFKTYRGETDRWIGRPQLYRPHFARKIDQKIL